MRVSEPSPPQPGRNADLRPGTAKGRPRDHAIRSAHCTGCGGRGESKATERWLCHGQYDSDANVGANGKTGLGSRQAREGPTGAPVQADGGRQATDGDGSTPLGASGAEVAQRSRRCGLEEYTRNDISNDRSRYAGVIVRNHLDVYTST